MLLEARAAHLPLPRALVFISPWVDLTQTGESMKTRNDADPLLSAVDLADCAQKYLGDKAPQDPSVALLESDLRGLPRMLVHVGEDEILLSDAERLAQRAHAAGINVTLKIWPQLWHVFHAWAPQLPEANRAISEVGEFVNVLASEAP
jgi:acetyl esterase/lipase